MCLFLCRCYAVMITIASEAIVKYSFLSSILTEGNISTGKDLTSHTSLKTTFWLVIENAGLKRAFSPFCFSFAREDEFLSQSVL